MLSTSDAIDKTDRRVDTEDRDPKAWREPDPSEILDRVDAFGRAGSGRAEWGKRRYRRPIAFRQGEVAVLVARQERSASDSRLLVATVLPMLKRIFASFNRQGIDGALPDFPDEPMAFGVKVPYGVGPEGPPYATAEEPLGAVHRSLVDAGYACGDFHGTGILCDVATWDVLVEDVEAPVVGPDGAKIFFGAVPPVPTSE